MGPTQLSVEDKATFARVRRVFDANTRKEKIRAFAALKPSLNTLMPLRTDAKPGTERHTIRDTLLHSERPDIWTLVETGKLPPASRGSAKGVNRMFERWYGAVSSPGPV